MRLARTAAAQLRVRRSLDAGRDETQQLHDARSSSGYSVLLDDALWAATSPVTRNPAIDVAFQSLQDSIASSAGAAVAQLGARFSSGDDALRRLARPRA